MTTKEHVEDMKKGLCVRVDYGYLYVNVSRDRLIKNDPIIGWIDSCKNVPTDDVIHRDSIVGKGIRKIVIESFFEQNY
jgi:hypothetical protein